jgi:hypothetical protein
LISALNDLLLGPQSRKQISAGIGRKYRGEQNRKTKKNLG